MFLQVGDRASTKKQSTMHPQWPCRSPRQQMLFFSNLIVSPKDWCKDLTTFPDSATPEHVVRDEKILGSSRYGVTLSATQPKLLGVGIRRANRIRRVVDAPENCRGVQTCSPRGQESPTAYSKPYERPLDSLASSARNKTNQRNIKQAVKKIIPYLCSQMCMSSPGDARSHCAVGLGKKSASCSQSLRRWRSRSMTVCNTPSSGLFGVEVVPGRYCPFREPEGKKEGEKQSLVLVFGAHRIS